MTVYKIFAAWQKHYFDEKHQRELEKAGRREDPVTNVNRSEVDKDFLRGKNFLKHTNAFRHGDLNPLRVKDLLGEVKALKDENKHLRETIVNLKVARSQQMRSPSPPRGRKNWQKGIHGLVSAQKFAYQNMSSSPVASSPGGY